MNRKALLAAALVALPAAAQDWLEGNVCAAQIQQHVAANFGQTVKGIEFRYIEQQVSKPDRRILSQAIAVVEECPGYHYFEVQATADMCEMLPHYGAQPNYLRYLGPFDGC